jgi:hypothetical protein
LLKEVVVREGIRVREISKEEGQRLQVVDDVSHEGLRVLLREEGVSFHVIKTFKASKDPDYEAKENRVLELYDIAPRELVKRANVA